LDVKLIATVGVLSISLAIAALALATLAWIGARQLIYPVHRRAIVSPADYGLEAETIAFKTRDRLILRGWFIPAPHPKGTIVFCHGYAGDCSPDLIYAPDFHRAGYNLLLFDFRGHGASDGAYTSLVYFERGDLLDALDFLRSRGIARVGLMGFSMGGAIALTTAPLSPMVVGVISDCTFAELWHVVRHGLPKRGFPAFLASPLGWLIVLFASLLLRANLFSADPIRRVGDIAPRPVLIMHGEEDDDAPVEEAQRLFRAARAPKELWIVPGAAHRRIEEVVRDGYRQRVIEFFDQAFGVGS
jgi:alpha-beta hydrolase superfamily lysophospholipase